MRIVVTRFVWTCAVLSIAMSHPVFGQSPAMRAVARNLLPESLQSKTAASTALQSGVSGTWWRDPEWVKALGLTADQQKKMDDTVAQFRTKLLDLNAVLSKEEALLEPLLNAVRPSDEGRILAQIDRIAEARAELEKTNARMLLAIRQALTQEQWAKLSADPGKKSGTKDAAVPGNTVDKAGKRPFDDAIYLGNGVKSGNTTSTETPLPLLKKTPN